MIRIPKTNQNRKIERRDRWTGIIKIWAWKRLDPWVIEEEILGIIFTQRRVTNYRHLWAHWKLERKMKCRRAHERLETDSWK